VLSDRLGDRSWWVRRAAADALVALGPAGLAQLGRAARAHPDRFARDIAEQALRDHVPNLVQAVVG
jgi:HEAT repeat protein